MSRDARGRGRAPLRRRDGDRDPLAVFEDDLRRRGLAPTTCALYLATARRLLAACPELSAAALRRYLAERFEALAPATQASEVYRVRSFLRALRDAERLDAAVLAAVAAPGLPTRRAPPALGEDDVAHLLAAASRAASPRAGAWVGACRLRDRAALELLYALGLRASELAAARTSDLSLAEGVLVVRRAKRGSPEPLPLPPGALPPLRRYLAEGRPRLVGGRPDPGHLLLSRFGRPLDRGGVGALVAAVGRRAALSVRPHALRRAVAVHLVARGVSVPAVQRLLGHARLTTTQRYLPLGLAELRAAVAHLEA